MKPDEMARMWREMDEQVAVSAQDAVTLSGHALRLISYQNPKIKGSRLLNHLVHLRNPRKRNTMYVQRLPVVLNGASIPLWALLV